MSRYRQLQASPSQAHTHTLVSGAWLPWLLHSQWVIIGKLDPQVRSCSLCYKCAVVLRLQHYSAPCWWGPIRPKQLSKVRVLLEAWLILDTQYLSYNSPPQLSLSSSSSWMSSGSESKIPSLSFLFVQFLHKHASVHRIVCFHTWTPCVAACLAHIVS